MSNEVQKSLRPLFRRAEQEGLWFYSSYQGIWFSPSSLRDAQARGNFRWGAVNWQLRNPMDRVNELREEAKRLLRNADALEQEISGPVQEPPR